MAGAVRTGRTPGGRAKAPSDAGSGAKEPGTPKAPKASTRTTPPPETPSADPQAPVCGVGFCPIGLALSAVQPLRPDVVEHLLVAGRELLLAMRATLDARAEQFEGEGTKPDLQKIDIG